MRGVFNGRTLEIAQAGRREKANIRFERASQLASNNIAQQSLFIKIIILTLNGLKRLTLLLVVVVAKFVSGEVQSLQHLDTCCVPAVDVRHTI